MSHSRLVLHIAPTPFFADRGCHIRIEGIANCLKSLQYDNLVCTYHHGRDIKGINTSRISQIKNYTQTEAGPSKFKLWADWKLLWLVVRECLRTKPDVIHAHLHEGLMIGLIAKGILFWRRTPLVADMQGSLYGELETHGTFEKYSFLKGPVKLIERILMMCAKTVICSSEHALSKFQSDFNLSKQKLSLVQDGANLIAPLPDKAIAELKTKWSIPSTKTVVVYSGALLDGKGLNELKALILQNQESTDLYFLIIGYPTENLDGFLAEHKVNHLCTFTGQIPFESLPDLLGIADIAVDPKFNEAGEGSGKMLNYLANGLPVLAFDTQNNRRFLPDGAKLASSVEAMNELLNDWIKNPQQLSKISTDNLAHFIRNHSWKQTELQLNGVYQRLNADHSTPS